MRRAMWDGLGSRMAKWAEDSNLVLATILDPRYKMSYFSNLTADEQERYRLSLTMEVEALVDAASSDAGSADEMETDEPCTSAVASYFADWEATFLSRTPKQQRKPHSSLEARHKAEIIVKRYLKEARIGPDEDPYEYWAAKDDENWGELKLVLVQRFHCAPAGSVESERLFSTTGFIVNDLRKKLLVENLEKLLFCHHNLPIYDFKYQE